MDRENIRPLPRLLVTILILSQYYSTRLHMDMADAINILMHANPKEDGSPGCAVWDLYKPEDADAIRSFLIKKYEGSKHKFTDPIHSQIFYLDSELRQELRAATGVVSYRIYQYPVSGLHGSESYKIDRLITLLDPPGTSGDDSSWVRTPSLQFERLH